MLEDLSASGKISGTIGTLLGAGLGYCLGAEAVEYARKVVENPDVVSYMIKVHPYITEFLTTVGFGAAGMRLGTFCG